MEISVDQVDALPAHTYLSVRYGEVRKQAPFRAGEVISFAQGSIPGEKPAKAYSVDVFRKVGSKQVSLAGITAMEGVVRSENLMIPSLEIMGLPVTASLTAKLVQDRASTPTERRDQVIAQKARNYLQQHGLQSVLHEMFASLLDQQPSDPYNFMIAALEHKREEANADPEVAPDFALEPGLGPGPYPGFEPEQDLPDLGSHHSLVAEILRKDPAIYDRLRNEKTSRGVCVQQCIKPGIDCPGHELVKVAGVFAGDEESYTKFRDVFDPVISLSHPGWEAGNSHVSEADPSKLPSMRIDPSGKYAVFASMEVRRNIRGIAFPTCCSWSERRDVEAVLAKAMQKGGGMGGNYFPLRYSESHAAMEGGMKAYQEERLRCVGMLFNDPDSRLRLCAGVGRDWPDARGVFVGDAQGVYLWCNEEDHLRFFMRQHVVDLKKCWAIMHKTVEAFSQNAEVEYSYSDRLGYTTACPSRLGSALRISVCLKIPLLAATTDLLGLCRLLRVVPNQEAENPTFGRVWNITSEEMLGVSEVALIESMIRACGTLVELEVRLEKGEPIYDAMPGLGAEAVDGFPTDRCPETMPTLACSRSMVASVLQGQPDIYDRLKQLKTPMDVNLALCVKPAFDARGLPVADFSGLVAGDEASYETFAELFDPVISRLHADFKPEGSHRSDALLEGLAEANEKAGSFAQHGVTVRVELRRNLRGLRLAPCCTAEERREVERLVCKAMFALGDQVGGEYFPLTSSCSYAPRPGGTDAAVQEQLTGFGLIFKEPASAGKLAAGIGRHWPDARGAFVARGGDLAVWCNEEDHVRVFAVGGYDLGAAFCKASACVEALGKCFEADERVYMYNERLGYLTVDPAKLGAGLSATVVMRLPRLSARPDFAQVCQSLRLKVQLVGNDWEVSSRPGLGATEASLLGELHEGCAKLSALEGQLEAGRSVEGSLPTADAS